MVVKVMARVPYRFMPWCVLTGVFAGEVGSCSLEAASCMMKFLLRMSTSRVYCLATSALISSLPTQLAIKSWFKVVLMFNSETA